MKIGTRVKFEPKVFTAPYVPYYDAYFGEVFEIIQFHVDSTVEDDLIESDQYELGCHVELKCVSNPSIVVAGLVHDNELYSYHL